MTSPDIISFSTAAALREATFKYSAAIAVPGYFRDVDGFAAAYLGEAPAGATTLITEMADSLAITVCDNEDITLTHVNIDLAVPGYTVPVIVAPGYYDEKGKRSTHGTLMRPVVRPLKEGEGQELTMDLYAIIAKTPLNRRRT